MTNDYTLKRFVDAQSGEVYERALQEIRNGRKTTHWMWFIFPQIKGLGRTPISQYYSIQSVEEAKAYLEDPVLSPRLREITKALLTLQTSDADEVFGFPDCMKLKSSMTLLDYISPNDIFAKVLEKYYSGSRDNKTLSLIKLN